MHMEDSDEVGVETVERLLDTLHRSLSDDGGDGGDTQRGASSAAEPLHDKQPIAESADASLHYGYKTGVDISMGLAAWYRISECTLRMHSHRHSNGNIEMRVDANHSSGVAGEVALRTDVRVDKMRELEHGVEKMVAHICEPVEGWVSVMMLDCKSRLCGLCNTCAKLGPHATLPSDNLLEQEQQLDLAEKLEEALASNKRLMDLLEGAAPPQRRDTRTAELKAMRHAAVETEAEMVQLKEELQGIQALVAETGAHRNEPELKESPPARLSTRLAKATLSPVGLRRGFDWPPAPVEPTDETQLCPFTDVRQLERMSLPQASPTVHWGGLGKDGLWNRSLEPGRR
jgi:hypothetical protein